MRQILLTALAALLLIAAAVACAGTDSEPAPPGGTPESPEPGATATAPESPAPAVPSPTPPAGSGAPSPIPSVTTGSETDPYKLVDPADAARHLYESWKAGDRAEARKFADQRAVDRLFQQTYTGPELELMGCTHAVDHYFCQYRYEGGALTFRVDGGVSAGYFVTEVTATAD